LPNVNLCACKKIKMKAALLLFLIFSTHLNTYGWDPADSAAQAKIAKPYNMRLVGRISSQGQFSYGGRIVSTNPVFDFNFTYDRKSWGLQIFKATDLVDRTTDINFMLAVVNKSFHFGSRLTMTPSVGFILEQNRTAADKGSDVALILTTGYKLSKHFTLEHSGLFGNLLLETSERDWVNRFRLLYSNKHLDLSAMLWHNNKLFDDTQYVTCGASAFYSRVKVSTAVSLSAGFTLLAMPYNSNPELIPQRNGLVFTLAAVID
jgi:hypothetical protein